MTNKKSSESRRELLKSIAAGSGAIVAGKSLPESWNRPVVDSVMLPAHAQTTGCFDIVVSSPQNLNDYERVIALVNSNDVTIGEDGTSGDLIINLFGLAPGTYRVFGDSSGEQSHTIIVQTTGCSEETITRTTIAANCTNLIATIDLPSGVITPENGDIPPGEPPHCNP